MTEVSQFFKDLYGDVGVTLGGSSSSSASTNSSSLGSELDRTLATSITVLGSSFVMMGGKTSAARSQVRRSGLVDIMTMVG